MKFPTSVAVSTCLVMVALSPVPASAATQSAPMTPPGRTLTVTVAGLPSSVVGKVIVTGPGTYRTVVRVNGSKRLTGLKAGTYRLRAKAVSTSFGKATAKKKTRSVIVTAKKGAKVLVLYTTPGTS